MSQERVIVLGFTKVEAASLVLRWWSDKGDK
jgi:hypothetical protein